MLEKGHLIYIFINNAVLNNEIKHVLNVLSK